MYGARIENTRESGRTTRCMDRARPNGLMGGSTKGSI